MNKSEVFAPILKKDSNTKKNFIFLKFLNRKFK